MAKGDIKITVSKDARRWMKEQFNYTDRQINDWVEDTQKHLSDTIIERVQDY